MGLGPNKSSLLTKLGKKQAWELSDEELGAYVSADQARRTVQRAMGRVLRKSKDDGSATKAKRTLLTLERLGFAPAICAQLRLSGKTESAIIKALNEKGLL